MKENVFVLQGVKLGGATFNVVAYSNHESLLDGYTMTLAHKIIAEKTLQTIS